MFEPLFVEDVAAMAVSVAKQAVGGGGAETCIFDEFLRLIADNIGSKAWLVHTSLEWAT